MLRGLRDVRIEGSERSQRIQRDPKNSANHFCARDGAGALTTATGVVAGCCTPINASPGRT